MDIYDIISYNNSYAKRGGAYKNMPFTANSRVSIFYGAGYEKAIKHNADTVDDSFVRSMFNAQRRNPN